MSSAEENSANATLFGEYAQHYARSRPQYPPALWQWVAAQCAGHALAWDAGCGSGQAALALAEHFEQVLASDISAELLAQAPTHARVHYRVAASEAMPLEPATLDLICVAQALHWFDLPRFWPLAQRALKPGALFVALAYGAFSLGEPFDALSRSAFFECVEPYQAPGNREIGAGYANIRLPFAMLEAPRLAIECRWTLQQLLDYAGSWSAAQRMRKESGVDPLPAYRAALAPLWGEPDTQRWVRMPLTLKVGRHSG